MDLTDAGTKMWHNGLCICPKETQGGEKCCEITPSLLKQVFRVIKIPKIPFLKYILKGGAKLYSHCFRLYHL